MTQDVYHALSLCRNYDPSLNMVNETPVRPAMTHLVVQTLLLTLQLYVERLAKAVRKKRADAEKEAAEAQHAAGAGHLPTPGFPFGLLAFITCYQGIQANVMPMSKSATAQREEQSSTEPCWNVCTRHRLCASL